MSIDKTVVQFDLSVALQLTDVIPVVNTVDFGTGKASQATIQNLKDIVVGANPASAQLGTVATFNTAAGTTVTFCTATSTVYGDFGYIGGSTPAVNPGTLTIVGGSAVDGTTVGGAARLGVVGGIVGTVFGDMRIAYNSMLAMRAIFSFAPGAVDLATVNPVGAGVGTFIPGVYSITGAASIGAAGIVLSGPGQYVFQITGALTTVGGIVSGGVPAVTLTNGATADQVFFVTGGGASIGAGSALFPTIFVGSIFGGSAAITTGAYNQITGRLLSEVGITIGCNNIISVPPSVSSIDLTAIQKALPLTGIIYFDSTISGTGNDITPDILKTFSVPAGTLTVNGDQLRVAIMFSTTHAGDIVSISPGSPYTAVGANVIIVGELLIMRISNTTYDYRIKFFEYGQALQQGSYGTGATNFTTTSLDITVVGQNTIALINGVTAQDFSVELVKTI